MTTLVTWLVAIAQNLAAAVIHDSIRSGVSPRGALSTVIGETSVPLMRAPAEAASSAPGCVEFFPAEQGWLRRHVTVFLGFMLLFAALYLAFVVPPAIRVLRDPGLMLSNARFLGSVMPKRTLATFGDAFQAWGVWRVTVLYFLVLALILAAVRSTMAARVRPAWTKEARAGWRMDLAVWIGVAHVFVALAVSVYAFWPVTPLAAALIAFLGLGLPAAVYQRKP